MKKMLRLFILGFLLMVVSPNALVEASSNYVNRVSHFSAVNGEISLDGYSYVKGVAIPNQSDVIQKLKFVNTETGKQVLTFNISNFYKFTSRIYIKVQKEWEVSFPFMSEFKKNQISASVS